MAEKFRARVDSSGGPDACWPWTGSVAPNGYGQTWLQGKWRRAHRVAFFLANGRWPEPCCCHACDVKLCCNPAHLFEGTHQDNSDDKVSKGRQSRGFTHTRGERCGMATLTDQQVRDIRANYALCRVSQSDLARSYGVRPSTVCRIVGGKRRQHEVSP
jgi:hypothetical protein